jgi:O-antigen ligase
LNRPQPLYLRILNGSWVGRDKAERAFEEQLARVPRGMKIHAAIAAVVLALIPGPTSVGEIATVVLLGFFLLRTPRTFRLWLHALGQPVPLLILGFVLWQFITLTWSPDRQQGLDEIASNRWALMILLLWPVIGWRNRFIAALAIGFLLGNLSQLAQLFWGGQDWFPWVREPDRISGWWDPAVAGTLLTAALGLHLPAAVMGTGRIRVIGLTGTIITLAALIATGTRGGWIAAVVLVGCTMVVAILVHQRRRTLLVGLGVLILAGIVAGLVLRGPIMSRVSDARADLAAAIDGDYTTSTGARIAMAGWAVQAFAEHPIRGVGAGGYQSWVEDHLRASGIDPAERSIHAHAHNAILHIAATTGLVGLAFACAIIICAFWNAFSHLSRATLGTYAAGPAFALLGLLLVSAFDVVHINAQSAAILGVLLALTPTFIPKAAWRRADTHCNPESQSAE